MVTCSLESASNYKYDLIKNDVRCRDLGSEENTREEVGCGRNEDVKMDEWSHQAGQN